MISRRAEEMTTIIRSHLVKYLMTSGQRCVGCILTPCPSPSGEGQGVRAPGVSAGCISCAETAGNELGRVIEEHIIHSLGGLRLTVPSLKAVETREKHRLIRRRFNGANHGQLAFQFGYCRKQVYNIVAKGED